MKPYQKRAITEGRELFEAMHGPIPYVIEVEDVVEDCPGSDVYGRCDFGVTPPRITLRSDLDEREFVEYLLHELAHLVCGLEEGHGEWFESTKEELSLRFWSRRVSVETIQRGHERSGGQS